MNMIVPPPVWTAIGWTLVHLAWVGALIGLAASIARRAMRRTTPEARHTASLLALIALAGSPLAIFALVYESAGMIEPIRSPSISVRPASSDTAEGGSPPRFATPPVFDLPVIRGNRSAWFHPWIDLLPWAWLVGASITTAWLAFGLIGVARLRRGAIRLGSGPVVRCCREAARSIGLARTVAVSVSDRVVSPLLVGIFRPTILLPASALTGWPPELVELALIHELAHLRRLDNLICLFQAIVEALLFFHPTTWWLSSWLRLERETCCDRIVIKQTGRPRVYAEWLASMADARPIALAPAFTERPLATRIRRILFMEDRPMSLKPTAPEALALALAGMLAASIVLPSLAVPAPSSDDKKADDLRRLAAIVADESPDKPDNHAKGPVADRRLMALLKIAQTQATLGDQPGAFKTLEWVKLGPVPEKDAPWTVASLMDAGYRTMVASVHYKAGDREGGRAIYRPLVERFGDPDPVRDAARVRFMERMMEGLARKALNSKGMEMVVAEVATTPTQEPAADPAEELGSLELLVELAKELAQRREIELLRPLVRHGLALCQLAEVPLMSATLHDCLGKALLIAGDEGEGRELIARGQAILAGLADDELKTGMTLLLATVEPTADFDGALARVRSVPPSRRNEAVRRIAGELCKVEPVGWYDMGGIKITIGDPGLSLKTPAGSRDQLARLVELAQTIEGPWERADTLAMLARLQSQAGDLAAIQTAESIPVTRQVDFPGPRNGFYDSIKPATFALIAFNFARLDNQAAADATFARSRELAKATADASERIIAENVLARSLEDSGRRADARAVLADAIPAALAQSEPRRSRMLGMLARTQLKTSGEAEARTTIEAVREEPGIEKAVALTALAQFLRDSGQTVAAGEVARQGLELLQPRDSDPKRTPGFRGGITRNGYIDYDVETPFEWLMVWRADLRPALERIAAGNEPDLVEMGPVARRGYLVSKVSDAFQSGGLDAALKAAETIESPETRADAVRNLAFGLSTESTRK